MQVLPGHPCLRGLERGSLVCGLEVEEEAEGKRDLQCSTGVVRGVG